MTKFDFISDDFAPGVSPGFQARDLLRFFLVDAIITLSLRLLYYHNLLPSMDVYVLLNLGGKLLLAAYMVWLISDRPGGWQAAGLTRAGRWWAWPLAIVILAAAMPLLLRLDLLNIMLLQRGFAFFGFLYVPTPQDVSLLIFSDLLSPWVRIVLLAFAILFGPFLEELAFRGVGMEGYLKTGGAFRAVFWTSVLFSIYHYDAARLLPLALLGAVFAVARLLSRSFWCSLFAHVAYNTFVLYIMARDYGFFEK
jgi:CAAX amino terminal protease family.